MEIIKQVKGLFFCVDRYNFGPQYKRITGLIWSGNALQVLYGLVTHYRSYMVW